MQALSERPVTVIEPDAILRPSAREIRLPVVEKFLEQVAKDDLPEGPKAFVSFELFEAPARPCRVPAASTGADGLRDLFLFTTLSGTGVDIQALWEDSKSVSPPHHLNFFNPRSVAICSGRVGLADAAGYDAGQARCRHPREQPGSDQGPLLAYIRRFGHAIRAPTVADTDCRFRLELSHDGGVSQNENTALIPARMGSSRFPGKPMAPLLGKADGSATCNERVARNHFDIDRGGNLRPRNRLTTLRA